MTSMSEGQIYDEAKKRVEAKKGFFIHFTVYILVNTMLLLIWAFLAGRGFPWFLFPLSGWGIGLFFHFLGVFIFSKQSHWERQQIAREMERLKKQ